MEEKQSLFEKLFLPHLDAAYNLARWIVERDQDAQDVVQEAYVRALKGFKGFRGANARAWLLTIVRNTAYNWTRKHSSNIIPFDEAIHAAAMEEPVSESYHEERKRQLYEALSRLSIDYREVLVLYEIEGWSYKQIASALNVPVGTIMSRLSRARRRLQEASSDHRAGATASAWDSFCCDRRQKSGFTRSDKGIQAPPAPLGMSFFVGNKIVGLAPQLGGGRVPRLMGPKRKDRLQSSDRALDESAATGQPSRSG